MPRELPLELWGIVFSYLHSMDWEPTRELPLPDKDDLAACTLVSRMWSAVARPHLFRDITYSFRPVPEDVTPNDQGDYCDTLEKYECLDPARDESRFKTFPMFFNFVSSSPVAQNSIRRLRLDGWPSTDEEEGTDYYPTLDAEPFVALLQMLPRLCVLHLFLINVVHPPARNAPMAHPSLRRLYISSVSNTDGFQREWEDVEPANILDCFVGLEELQLDLPNEPSYKAEAHEDWPAMQIGRLILGDSPCLSDGLHKYLLDVRRVESVPIVDIDRLYPETDIDLIGDLGCEELRLRVPNLVEDYEEPEPLSLSCFEQLERLVFKLSAPLIGRTQPDPHAFEVSLFSQFVHHIHLLESDLPGLVEVTIHLQGLRVPSTPRRIPKGVQIKPPLSGLEDELQEFDTVLTDIADTFGLQDITFSVNGTDPSIISTEDLEDLIRLWCPQLAEKKGYTIIRTNEGDDFYKCYTDHFLA
ncbi:hypothetical protein PsYK624_001680 [Phanerochaete sordida]|uniref:F-box domain-containing protein n=1 Tax=Phanerochaete sordida TaxID=48140 RepID=A0A9P3FVZ1_9APHY|nr:hypothetical protein PsYK624_001680 [Phanerochaete sordida]